MIDFVQNYPVVVAMAATILAGVVCMLLYEAVDQAEHRRYQKQLRQEIAELQDELRRLELEEAEIRRRALELSLTKWRS